MKAETLKGKSTADIKSGLEQCLATGFKPTLAIAFISKKEAWKSVHDLLNQKGIIIFGLTTAIAFDSEEIESEGIVIMLMDMNPDYFKISLSDNENSSNSTSVKQTGDAAAKAFSNSGLLISVAGLNNPGNEILEGLVKEVGVDLTIMGGYAGDAETFEGFVFTNGKSSRNGLMALIIDMDKVEMKGVAVSGWRAVGTEKTVTQSDGLWIKRIDDQPATEVFKKFVGDALEESKDKPIRKLDYSRYVLQIERGGDSPQYFAPLEYNSENGAVKVSIPLNEGKKFRFSLPPDFDTIDEVIRSSRKLKEKEMPEIDALIIFSCFGRYSTLGPLAMDEFLGLSQTWSKSTAGFFSLGEFGRVEGGRPEHHGGTCSWVALKEK